jgi:hypothetical protein
MENLEISKASLNDIKLYESLGYQICEVFSDERNPDLQLVKMIKEKLNISSLQT